MPNPTPTNPNPIIIDSDDDMDVEDEDQSPQLQSQHTAFGHGTPIRPQPQPQPATHTLPPSSPFQTYNLNPTEREIEDKRNRTRNREIRHTALTILADRELLTVTALAANESIPQTRRKYLSRLLAPEDSDAEREIRGDMFVLQFPDETGEIMPMAVRRGIVDVHEDGDGGWIRRADSGSRSASGSRSRKSGSLTPERAKGSRSGDAGKRRVSGRG